MFKFFCALLFSTSIIQPSALEERAALCTSQQNSPVSTYSSMPSTIDDASHEQAKLVSLGDGMVTDKNLQPEAGVAVHIPEDNINTKNKIRCMNYLSGAYYILGPPCLGGLIFGLVCAINGGSIPH